MCGISGIYHLKGKSVESDLLRKMTDAGAHRGPDDEGYVLINTGTGETHSFAGASSCLEIKGVLPPLSSIKGANLGLGARRLSVLDLTSSGHQPMSDASKMVWLTYNGEIYNYRELRTSLEKKGYIFHSDTDTEVIICAYIEWGYKCLERFRGMWSFALWDVRKQTLFCSRDRFGIKPFYYFVSNDTLFFGSEIKQLLPANPETALNERMLCRILKMGSFMYYEDESLFQTIKVLPHSHYLLVSKDSLKKVCYYDLPIEEFESSDLSFAEASRQYRDKLSESIALHTRSDVEVGSCLSGGLDSSAIVSIAGKLSNRPLNTFTSYYTNTSQLDERKWVELLAQSCNLKTNFVNPQPEDFIRDFETITFSQDYPVIGSSPFTQYYLMRSAQRAGLKVLLDGQGSDEINVGYDHSFYRYYADKLGDRQMLGFLREFFVYLATKGGKRLSEKMLKTLLVRLFPETTLYRKEIRHNVPNVLYSKFSKEELLGKVVDLPTSKLSTFLYHLVMTMYLQSLLHFEDRNSMAFSIESRVPFLDHELVEFMFRQPAEYKIKGATGKLLHRTSLRGIVPDPILDRKDKVNFAAPGESIWLKGELHNYFRNILQSKSLAQRGLFDIKRVNTLYRSYISGKSVHGTILWKIMATEIWLRVFTDGKWRDLIS